MVRKVKRGECPECGTKLYKIGLLKNVPINGKSRNGQCVKCHPIAVPETIDIRNNLICDISMFPEDDEDNVSAITLDRKIRNDNGEVCDEGSDTSSLRSRMAKFLAEPAPECAPTTKKTPSSPTKSSLKLTSERSANSLLQQQRSSLSASVTRKQPFRGLFVPEPVSEDLNIRLDQKETMQITIEERPNPGDLTVPTMQTLANSKEKSGSQLQMEIVLDHSSSNHNDDSKALSTEPLEGSSCNDSPTKLPTIDLSGMEDSSLLNLAPDEYSEYSSKLLKMLDETETDEAPIPDIVLHTPDEFRLSIQTPETAPTTNETSNPSSPVPRKKSPPPMSPKSAPRSPSRSSSHATATLSPKPVPPVSPNQGPPASPKPAPPLSPKPAPPSPIKQPPPSSPKRPPSELKSASSIDLQSLLRHLETSSSDKHAQILQQISDRMWNETAEFVQYSGIKILASTMWADMMVLPAERAALEVVSVLAAYAPQLLNHPDTDDLVDALLIVMQTLIMDEKLQITGCRILCCLAASRLPNDGTRSGACLAVMNAMDAHKNNTSLQEWGLRTVYNQCTRSQNAESNKRTLLTSKLDKSGSHGGDVLEHNILGNHAGSLRDGAVLEWACRLFWILSSSSDGILDLLNVRIEVVRELLHKLEQCRSKQEASSQLQEAILGLFVNLVRLPKYRSFLGTPDVLLLVLDTMHGNKTYAGVQVEACSMIANVTEALSPPEKDDVVVAGAVRTIVGACFAFPEAKTLLQEPAFRALAGLASDSEVTKEAICEHETLTVLLRLGQLDQDCSSEQQEFLVRILASLYSSDHLQEKALQCNSLGAVTLAASKFWNIERVQEAVCIAFRNLALDENTVEHMADSDIVELVFVAMKEFEMSSSIQTNACFILWRIGSATDLGSQKIAEAGALTLIVKAIQMHLDTYEVMEAACGALWGLLHRSRRLAQQFFDMESGVESVTSVFLMHPRSTSLLEKACGVLGMASDNPSPALSPSVMKEGTRSIVEAMRNNPDSLKLLQYGCYFLRNIIFLSPGLINEAGSVLSLVLETMRDFTKSETFLREACYFIWAMSELSRDAKSKIQSMNGATVILSILDNRRESETLETAASGAYKEIAEEYGGSHPYHNVRASGRYM